MRLLRKRLRADNIANERRVARGRVGRIVYLALLPRENDESALKQIAYFCNSVGSLRGKLEFNPALLFCPAEWKSTLNIAAKTPADIDLHRRVKKAFDPNGTFAPGRFVGDF